MGAKGMIRLAWMPAAVVLTLGGAAGKAWAGDEEAADAKSLSPDDLKSAVPSLQWTLTLENGGGIMGSGDWSVAEGVYHFGGHANLLFRRKGPGAWAGGLAMTAGSLDMKRFMAGAGVSLLIPVSDFLPIIVEAFPLYLRGKKKNSMSVGGRLWWGLHSFNYHGSEVATLGIYMIFQKVVLSDDSKLWFAVWGIDFSLHILAIPFGMAGQAMVRKKRKNK
jgi:hypothetical protein